MSAFIMKEIVIFFYLLLLPLAIDTKQRNIFRNTAKLRTQRPQTVDLLKNSMLCTILSVSYKWSKVARKMTSRQSVKMSSLILILSVGKVVLYNACPRP